MNCIYCHRPLAQHEFNNIDYCRCEQCNVIYKLDNDYDVYLIYIGRIKIDLIDNCMCLMEDEFDYPTIPIQWVFPQTIDYMEKRLKALLVYV